MLSPSDAAAYPVATGNALGKPRLTTGVFLLGDPTTTCCVFVNHSLSRGAPYLVAHRGGSLRDQLSSHSKARIAEQA